ncbi:putative defense protein 3 isoform X2 [Lytechinus variegatus]|uniref:putative defense protein 3 isoform X2 n=1 Tax=Lytechinus variegatus TaxID=7654 RepID=UPI001BB1DA26|nr:putative defense protein 3 isoform X2 [Lytechinus variegatus]
MAGSSKPFNLLVISKIVVMIVCLVHNSKAYPGGAPIQTCSHMTPQHSSSPQTSNSPYTMSISHAAYTPGQQITVTVTDTSTVSSGFKGILMQMRRKDSDGVVGTWTVENTANFRTISCNGNPDAVTHANGNDKGATNTFTWTAPQDSNPGDVYVVATFVKDFSTFWVEQTSSYIGAN